MATPANFRALFAKFRFTAGFFPFRAHATDLIQDLGWGTSICPFGERRGDGPVFACAVSLVLFRANGLSVPVDAYDHAVTWERAVAEKIAFLPIDRRCARALGGRRITAGWPGARLVKLIAAEGMAEDAQLQRLESRCVSPGWARTYYMKWGAAAPLDFRCDPTLFRVEAGAMQQ